MKDTKINVFGQYVHPKKKVEKINFGDNCYTIIKSFNIKQGNFDLFIENSELLTKKILRELLDPSFVSDWKFRQMHIDGNLFTCYKNGNFIKIK